MATQYVSDMAQQNVCRYFKLDSLNILIHADKDMLVKFVKTPHVKSEIVI